MQGKDLPKKEMVVKKEEKKQEKKEDHHERCFKGHIITRFNESNPHPALI